MSASFCLYWRSLACHPQNFPCDYAGRLKKTTVHFYIETIEYANARYMWYIAKSGHRSSYPCNMTLPHLWSGGRVSFPTPVSPDWLLGPPLTSRLQHEWCWSSEPRLHGLTAPTLAPSRGTYSAGRSPDYPWGEASWSRNKPSGRGAVDRASHNPQAYAWSQACLARPTTRWLQLQELAQFKISRCSPSASLQMVLITIESL